MNEHDERFRTVSAHDCDRRSTGGVGRRPPGRPDWLRLLVRLGVGFVALGAVSGTVGAHGTPGRGGGAVLFAVVVGLPVVVGLVAGMVVSLRRWGTCTHPAGNRTGAGLGLLLAVLGVTFGASAVTEGYLFGIAVGALGVMVALWAGRHTGTSDRRSHANVTLGAVSAHRLVEGIALGAIYSSGLVVGLLATLVVAGHTALEAAAVGGLYGQYRLRAVGAVVLVQAGYAAGAVIGFGVAVAIPGPVHAGAAALAGGVLFGVGVGELRHSVLPGRGSSIR